MNQFKSYISENALLPFIGLLIPIWLPGALLISLIHLLGLIIYRQIQNPLRRPSVWLTGVAASYLLIQVTGLLNTEDFNNGIFNLQQKLSLLFFPVLLTSGQKINWHVTRKTLLNFCVGSIAISVFLLLKATWHWLNEKDIQVFYYQQLASHLHPSYLAAYLCFSIGIIGPETFTTAMPVTRLKRIIGLIEILFCLGVIYLLQSKAGIIVAFCIILFLFASWFYKEIWHRSLGLRIIVVAAFVGLCLFAISRIQNERFKAMFDTLQNGHLEQDPHESTQLRLAVWQSGVAVFEQNWLCGTGAGDVKHDLNDEYTQRGMHYAADLMLNAHNQFLQTAIGGGIFQLLLLIAFILLPARLTPHRYRLPALLLVFIIVVNMLFESYFESQWGLVFACFFIALFSGTHAPLDTPREISI